MKKIFLCFIGLSMAIYLQASVSKNITLTTAGTLSSFLTDNDKNTITDLTVSGPIDASDFVVIRSMSYSNSLSSLNLKDALIDYIPTCAFRSCLHLTSVVLPNSITSIESEAFLFCGGIRSVVIPNSVRYIGYSAFQTCGLTSITIPKSVVDIKYNAFYFSKDLEAINVDEANTTYASVDGVMYNKAKTSIQICPEGRRGTVIVPQTVTSIGKQAFDNCNKIANVVLPNSVTAIEESAFDDCDGLTAIIIPNSVTSIGYKAFYSCDNLVSVSIPNSVTSIGSWAFDGCKLKSITIPSSIVSIEDEAFIGCSSVSTIFAMSPTPVPLTSRIFLGVLKSIPLYVPNGSKAAYQAAEGWNMFTNIIEIGNDIVLSANSIDLTNVNADEVIVATINSWTASCDQTWLTVSPQEGDSVGVLSISAEPNTSTVTRSATIAIAPKLKTDGESKTITVTQALLGTAVTHVPIIETSIYPNPTHSQITISTSAADGQLVVLIAPNGTAIAKTYVSNGIAEFPVFDLKKGIYIVQLQTIDEIVTQQIVVE